MANPICPTCGGKSENAGEMRVKLSGEKNLSLRKVFRCTNQKCNIELSDYPYGEWPTEFVIVNGKKHILEPAKSEFP